MMARKPVEAPQSVTQAAESGSREELLIALRGHVARACEDCSPRDLVGLSRRLLDLDAELRSLEYEAATSPVLRVVDERFDASLV